ncbi:acyl-protein thioesterase 1 [Cyathus striatus]|nr:acyl-protein thioesterase 1 [Cyathus striatus]
MADDSFVPECTIIEPREQHTATIIWLHGLGDAAHGMQPFAYYVSVKESMAHVKFILPSAPCMHVTVNHKRFMPSWFDYYSFDPLDRSEDEQGLYRSTGWIKSIIEKEIIDNVIPSERIIVGGLSQGGAVSLLLGITYKEHHLGGVFVLSSYVPLRGKVSEIMSPHATTIPIFWGHGTADELYNHSFAVETTKTLANDLSVPFKFSDGKDEEKDSQTKGIGFHSYEGLEHWMKVSELDDLAKWLNTLLPKVMN